MSEGPWPYFDPRVDKMLRCPHCLSIEMVDAFMLQVVKVREAVGLPFRINSGYRCPEYNARVSNTGRTGPHTTGRALDIHAGSRMKFLILEAARAQGFTRFGMGSTFIHLDDLGEADGVAPSVVWVY